MPRTQRPQRLAAPEPTRELPSCSRGAVVSRSDRWGTPSSRGPGGRLVGGVLGGAALHQGQQLDAAEPVGDGVVQLEQVGRPAVRPAPRPAVPSHSGRRRSKRGQRRACGVLQQLRHRARRRAAWCGVGGASSSKFSSCTQAGGPTGSTGSWTRCRQRGDQLGRPLVGGREAVPVGRLSSSISETIVDDSCGCRSERHISVSSSLIRASRAPRRRRRSQRLAGASSGLMPATRPRCRRTAGARRRQCSLRFSPSSPSVGIGSSTATWTVPGWNTFERGHIRSPALRKHHRHDRHPGLHGQVEGALLERPGLGRGHPGALGEDHHRGAAADPVGQRVQLGPGLGGRTGRCKTGSNEQPASSIRGSHLRLRLGDPGEVAPQQRAHQRRVQRCSGGCRRRPPAGPPRGSPRRRPPA